MKAMIFKIRALIWSLRVCWNYGPSVDLNVAFGSQNSMPESDLDFLISISLSALVHPTIATENPVRSNMVLIFDRVSGLCIIRTKQELRQLLVAAVLDEARSIIANFEGARRARRRATMGAVKCRTARSKRPATGFPARALNLAMLSMCR